MKENRESKANLSYIVSSRSVWAIYQDLVSKKEKKKKKNSIKFPLRTALVVRRGGSSMSS
jgi:hypothetical protein